VVCYNISITLTKEKEKEMIKNVLKRIALSMSAFALVAGFVVAPVAVHAQSNISDKVCDGFKTTGDNLGCDDTGDDNSFAGLAKRVINIFSIVVGAVSVIMIIIGGFRYIISGGDSNGVSGAKNTIMYAIIGLVVVLFAQVIVRFVIANTSNQ
jgi:hypothetical protein